MQIINISVYKHLSSALYYFNQTIYTLQSLTLKALQKELNHLEYIKT